MTNGFLHVWLTAPLWTRFPLNPSPTWTIKTARTWQLDKNRICITYNFLMQLLIFFHVLLETAVTTIIRQFLLVSNTWFSDSLCFVLLTPNKSNLSFMEGLILAFPTVYVIGWMTFTGCSHRIIPKESLTWFTYVCRSMSGSKELQLYWVILNIIFMVWRVKKSVKSS